jgi:hypothetical protein
MGGEKGKIEEVALERLRWAVRAGEQAKHRQVKRRQRKTAWLLNSVLPSNGRETRVVGEDPVLRLEADKGRLVRVGVSRRVIGDLGLLLLLGGAGTGSNGDKGGKGVIIVVVLGVLDRLLLENGRGSGRGGSDRSEERVRGRSEGVVVIGRRSSCGGGSGWEGLLLRVLLVRDRAGIGWRSGRRRGRVDLASLGGSSFSAEFEEMGGLEEDLRRKRTWRSSASNSSINRGGEGEGWTEGRPGDGGKGNVQRWRQRRRGTRWMMSKTRPWRWFAGREGEGLGREGEERDGGSFRRKCDESGWGENARPRKGQVSHRSRL